MGCGEERYRRGFDCNAFLDLVGHEQLGVQLAVPQWPELPGVTAPPNDHACLFPAQLALLDQAIFNYDFGD